MSAANGTQHQGVFIESGSGGYMGDLTLVVLHRWPEQQVQQLSLVGVKDMLLHRTDRPGSKARLLPILDRVSCFKEMGSTMSARNRSMRPYP